MNDHSSHRRRSSQPAWPTGDDPDSSAGSPRRRHHASEQQEERTGFWSPLWEEDEDEPPRGRSGGHHRNGSNGSNGRASHRLPDNRASHRADPPAPRPGGPMGGGPAWPTEEPPVPQRPAGNPAGAPRPAADPRTRVVRPRPGGAPPPGGQRPPGGPGGPGAAGVDPDGPTELLPSVHNRTGPEPALLTHREPADEDDLRNERGFDDEYYDEDEDAPLSGDQKALRRKKIWRRVRRTGYVLTALMIIVPLIGFFVAYQVVEVPTPETVADGQGQVARLTFADGSPMGEMVPPGGENRQMIKYEDIPEQVKNAVFAAEDAEFMTNPGFDIAGVMRAGWNQVTGGRGGGSTITQQYIKKATGNEEKSITRKALEVVQAYKMNNTYSKEDIITAYLNTIYFGRGAYGISAAANAYYDKPLKEITASQAALLAGMIQLPSQFDDRAYMERRWNFVIGQMVDKGWFPADQAKTEEFPELADYEKTRPKALTGPNAHVQRAVMAELKEAGITEEEVFRRGLTIRTTIAPRAQQIAVQSVREVMKDEPPVNLPALVAVNPKNGEIVAYYGGENGVGIDWAAARQEPGSSFKPFDLVALLQKGMGLGERYDGTSGRMFEGRKDPVRNSGGASCGEECTVATAMEKSINTVFYDVAVNTVGTKAVERAARSAGITSDLNGEAPEDAAPDGNISIGGGNTRVSTVEMASAYATFASGGIRHKAHLVAEVKYPDDRPRWSPTVEDEYAFDADQATNQKIARNVTESLVPVLEYSDLECDDGRECAGKTGTHQLGGTEDNSKAWMVGYTPQISTAVSMSAQDKNNRQIALKNGEGGIVYGSGLPGEIWQKFMDEFLKEAPKVGFGLFDPIGKAIEDEQPTENDEPRDDESQDEQPSEPTEPTDDETQTSEPEEPTEPTEPSEPEEGTGDPELPGFPDPPGENQGNENIRRP